PKGMDPSFYTELIQLAQAQNIPVVFDASGSFLRAGLEGQPTYVKPNQDELAQIAGYDITSLNMAYEVGMEIQARYHTSPIITLGEEGGLAILSDRAYRFSALPVDVINTAGAGDGVLAGLAASIHRNEPIETGIRLGIAAATAVLLTPGTADCRRRDVERLLEQVELIPWP
ncbi:MAG: PfkB family carbohydrate kinase, partial [Chloroflexota bacterium]